jgi:hypothetical protein
MDRALLVLAVGTVLGFFQTPAAALDVERECRSISESDSHGCKCLGQYFVTKFGPEDGAAALHLVERSFVPEPRINTATLYERFGADTLNRVAHRILGTFDEAVSSCPISAHIAE